MRGRGGWAALLELVVAWVRLLAVRWRIEATFVDRLAVILLVAFGTRLLLQ